MTFDKYLVPQRAGMKKYDVKKIAILTEWVVFILLYLVNEFVYPQSDQFLNLWDNTFSLRPGF